MIERMQILITRLKVQREKFDEIITALETLAAVNQGELKLPKKRGRKSMGMEERARVAARMKLYWAQRREAEATWDR